MNRTAALAAVVVILAASSSLLACKKKSKGDAVDEVVVSPPLVELPPAEPRPIGALLLEAQRRASGLPFARVQIEYVGPDGIMDPGFATVEVTFASPKVGPTDDPTRRTGAPVLDKPRTRVTTCPRLAWRKGRWDTKQGSCAATGMTLRCTPQLIWGRAIVQGAPSDAVARLTIDANVGARDAPGWRFDITDTIREVSFHKVYPDDCGLAVEAPDPTVVADTPLPESLERQMITNGIGVIKPKVIACGSGDPARGTVKVSVKVSPDGAVVAVSVKATPSAALGACVAAAIQSATFAKTQSGGSFSYPFVF